MIYQNKLLKSLTSIYLFIGWYNLPKNTSKYYSFYSFMLGLGSTIYHTIDQYSDNKKLVSYARKIDYMVINMVSSYVVFENNKLTLLYTPTILISNRFKDIIYLIGTLKILKNIDYENRIKLLISQLIGLIVYFKTIYLKRTMSDSDIITKSIWHISQGIFIYLGQRNVKN